MKLDDIQLNGIKYLKKNVNVLLSLYTGLGKSKVLLYWLKDHVELDKRVVLIVPKSILVKWVDEVKDVLGINRLVHVLSFGMIKQFESFIQDADVLIVDEPKLLKNQNNQVFMKLMSMPRKRGQRRIWVDATIVECHMNDELEAISSWFGLESSAALVDCIYPASSELYKPARPVETKRIKIPILNKRQQAAVKFSELDLGRAVLPRVKNVLRANAAIGRALSLLNGFSEGELGPVKLAALTDLIGTIGAAEAGVICVTNKDAMNAIHTMLWKTLNIPAVMYHGGLSAKARQEIVELFEAGEYQWVVATKAGERGLNLRRGTICIHFNLPWSGASFTQRDRVTRRDGDLTKTTRIYVLMFKDSVEELVYQKVKLRIRMNKDFIDGHTQEQHAESWGSWLRRKWNDIYKQDIEEVLGI